MSWALHGLHAGVILLGALAVLVLLRTPARDTRRVSRLRAAAAAGRLVEDAERRAERLLRPPAPTDRRLVVVALAGLGASAVHAAVGPGHFEEGLRFGLFFVALSVLQVAVSVQVLRRATPPLLAAAGLMDLGVVVVWALSRTVGLPFGLAGVEPVGWLDAGATVAELVVVGAAARWLRTERPAPRPGALAVLRSVDTGQ